ncbi:MAG: UDP-N-acetylglucosamine 2-epimerase (non-hydrolyzing) [Candidatus Rokubacteria bacterium]|nr:UDP-N-acetylglucosamine 2-epimerase (non-hydrolyzing) [Candidatus Rokubacteria bacterium]
MKVLNVVGARPNFVKIAPLLREMAKRPQIDPVLVHTGQHYDAQMSDGFFDALAIPAPDVNLGVGSGSHAQQTAEVMKRLEPVLEAVRPDVVLVVGDVNSTVAAALVATKLGIRVGHVEAGLRSFDRSMPEEINRLVTDALADDLFATEESGVMNLAREGVPAERVHFVGNVMIDALRLAKPLWQGATVFRDLGLDPQGRYGVVTLHRPSNVDDPRRLREMVSALQELARDFPLVFPVHPRVRTRLARESVAWRTPKQPLPARGLVCMDPLGYLDFVALVSRASIVLTDSGGIQEETTMLGVPCLTLRENTERPVTVTHGTNRVIGTAPRRIVDEGLRALANPPLPQAPPPLWDGHASARIVDVLLGVAIEAAA